MNDSIKSMYKIIICSVMRKSSPKKDGNEPKMWLWFPSICQFRVKLLLHLDSNYLLLSQSVEFHCCVSLSTDKEIISDSVDFAIERYNFHSIHFNRILFNNFSALFQPIEFILLSSHLYTSLGKNTTSSPLFYWQSRVIDKKIAECAQFRT